MLRNQHLSTDQRELHPQALRSYRLLGSTEVDQTVTEQQAHALFNHTNIVIISDGNPDQTEVDGTVTEQRAHALFNHTRFSSTEINQNETEQRQLPPSNHAIFFNIRSDILLRMIAWPTEMDQTVTEQRLTLHRIVRFSHPSSHYLTTGTLSYRERQPDHLKSIKRRLGNRLALPRHTKLMPQHLRFLLLTTDWIGE